MAIKNLEEAQRLKIEDSWESRSGEQVEDFITRHIISEGSYGEDEVLRLNKIGGEVIEIPVTVVQPTYDYAICLYGLRINGTIYKDPSLVILYKNEKETKVELGIGIRSIMDRGGTIKNYNTTFNVDITFNNQTLSKLIRNIDYSYFELQGGDYVLGAHENLEEVLIWEDVTKLFTKATKNKKISASFKPGDLRLEKELNITITNEILNLIYNGNIIVNTNLLLLTFESPLIDINNYLLVYYINGQGNGSDPYKLGSGEFIISNLTPGLNLVVVRAENYQNSDICSNWLNVNVIYTNGFLGTAVAINGVSSNITNNGVATLYKLIIYSTNREEFEFTTYLEDAEPSENPNPTQIIKLEHITAYSYNRETNTTEEYTYKKYIEVENTGSLLYLLIRVKDLFYTFYKGNYSNVSGKYSIYSSPYVEMGVEECILEYTYVKNYPISYNFDLITGQANNLFITETQSPSRATLISDLESSDGWKELDGLTYLKLSKQGKSVLKNPINLNLNDNFSIEMGFRTYNISDKNQTILTLGKLGLYPTLLGWMYENLQSEAFLKRNSLFQEGLNTHIVITVTKNWNINNSVYYPNYLGEVLNSFDEKAKQVSYNLVRIYINGGIDREFILNDAADLNMLKNSLLDILPKSSDIDWYLFRVYNTHALTHEDVVRNYISYIPEKTGKLSKESVYTKNDILDDSGRISWTKCIGKQNTLLFIYHTGGRFPNRFWGQEDNESSNDVNKKIPCTLVVNYADPTINAKYGGVLDKLQCKGLGSSAMRYLIWNVNSSLNKFKYKDAQGEEQKANSKFLPYSNLLNRDNRIDLLPENTNIDEVVSKYYPMPPYENELDKTTYKYTKMVGKVNFASSMQSHKIGACKLYDDAYKKSLGTASLPSRGKKAVHEEPFMYFYIETDEPFNSDYSSELDTDSITYAKILELGDLAKFMGFQTWGPGKGDDACSGYDEDNTPEYLMLEGGENTDSSVNFLRPWLALQRLRTDFVRSGVKYNYATDLKSFPTVTKSQSLAEPWAQLLIDDESIVYTDRGAWDIDYGFVEDEVGDTKYYDFAEGAKISLAKFRDFYDMVYKYDFTFIRVDSTITTPLPDWNVYKKYLVASNTFSINGVTVNGHQGGDVYRYDEPSASWVRAGLYYDNGWERLNYRLLIESETGEIAQTETQIKDILKALFIQKVKDFINLEDVAFHQAFVKFLSGTDNRAKNTYFLIIGTMANGEGDYKIRLIGDDLDTILVTDNSGLQSKPYNLIEDSYDESFEKTWGDAGNIFFRMFDLSFEQEIKALLKNIMDFAGLQSNGVNLLSGYFYKAFFKVLEDFPQLAYNHTASIYYENAYIIKNCGASYGFDYTHNNVDPIALSHGSCLECEKQFMKERIDFLAGYAKACLGNSLATSSAGAGGLKLKLLLEFEPFLDFYPTYYYDGKIPNIGIYSDSEYDIIKYKANAGNLYSLIVREESAAINQMLYLMNLYKTLSITGLLVDNLNANFATTTDLTIDNNLISENTDLFEGTYPKVSFVEFTPNFPVLENLNLISVSLPKELNLTSFYKLRNINLSDSIVELVIFPQTGILTTIVLPESIKTFEIYNNPKLETVTFESYDNIETVYIDCAKCGLFDVADFCEKLSSSSLNLITLRNIDNISLTEETLKKLLNVNCELEGEITIIDNLGDTTPKEISFETKQTLVNLFGDIDNGSHGLKINYTKSDRIVPTYPLEVNAYYDTNLGGILDKGNPFSFTIVGNNVNIIEGTNPVNPNINYRLDIKYSLMLYNSQEVELDEISGKLTIKKNPSIHTTARITINNTYYNSEPIVINFKWSVPQLGLFVYSDGTFSFNRIASKDLVGMIYDKTGNQNEGTLYVLGTEITNNKAYTSYLTNDSSSSNTGVHARISSFLEGIVAYFNLDSYKISGLLTFAAKDLINKSMGEDIKNYISAGLEDTQQYVNFVNTYILPKLRTKIAESKQYISEVIVDGYPLYKIDSIENLNRLCEILVNTNIVSGQSDYKYLNASVLFPYFYSAWLYKPENPGIYEDLQWYAPSGSDWSKIIYLYGYSTVLSSFDINNLILVFDGQLSTEVTDSNYTDNFINIPIFALANNKLLSNYPSAWRDIVDGNNKLVTSRSDDSNYGYVKVYKNIGGTTTPMATWLSGLYDYLWYSSVSLDLWGYTERLGGLPFTRIPYKNPQV